MSQYLFGSIQLSRGCPFQCEFCDVIVTFGRRAARQDGPSGRSRSSTSCTGSAWRSSSSPTTTSSATRQAIKPLLREIVAWQEAHGYPIMFSAEASLDLAEDAELMELMVDANVVSVFLGHREPERGVAARDEEAPERARGDDPGRARADGGACRPRGLVRHDPGLRPRRRGRSSSAQKAFLGEARIASAMVGMLAAIPKTAAVRAAGRRRADSTRATCRRAAPT